jgi:hypothetical protein
MKRENRGWTALIIGLLTFFVAACGDSNNFDDISGQRGNPGNQNPIFAGAYLGANNFVSQTAVLELDVANNGTATGTMTVSNLLQAQALEINPGVYDLTGTVNMSTGGFNLSGSFPGIGNFSIVGVLPVGNNQGSYTLTLNGQTFNGLIQNANLGTPTPPANGGNTGDQRIILGGTLSNFTFTPDGDYNGVNPPVDGGSVIGGAVVTGSDEENVVTISISETTVNGSSVDVRSLVFGIVTHNGQELVVGETYPLVMNEDGDGSLLSLQSTTGTTVNAAWTSTPGTSAGTVTLVALDDEGVELDFNFTNIIPNSEVANNLAEGTFDISGTVVAEFANLP